MSTLAFLRANSFNANSTARSLFFILSLLLLSSCSTTTKVANGFENASIRQQLAQKLILDFRYYCSEIPSPTSCQTPLTELPDEIAALISQTDLGGVILFSDNLQSIAQIVTLNHQLQQTSKYSNLKLPLFIAVDQEGGRVARLPRQDATSFTGSMSIAATYQNHGTYFAEQTGKILGQELLATGFNLNFAPTVDVNINPLNPVINVRSFGEDASVVAKLANTQLTAMQQSGILATLKHFPGHGDTSVDSHTGLPKVNHNLKKIEQVDLLPFQYAIDSGEAKVIMTAHIQYPALDNSTFVSKSGKTMVKPATMSSKILTELLRGKMGFDGLVITDALDMKGISLFFDEAQAVIETFKAGSDIALMPIKIRTPAELNKLDQLLDKLEQAVVAGKLDRHGIAQSFNRIVKAKSQLPSDVHPLAHKIKWANKTLHNEQSKKVEQALAQAAVTTIKGTTIKGTGLLPTKVDKIFMLMPDKNKCSALMNSMSKLNTKVQMSCMDFFNYEQDKAIKLIKDSDAVIIANITPNQSLVEMGGVEDLHLFRQQIKSRALPTWKRKRTFIELLSQAKAANKTSVFVSLRMPYEAKHYIDQADHVLATYAYNQYKNDDNLQVGVVYQAIANVLFGVKAAKGQLPVNL